MIARLKPGVTVAAGRRRDEDDLRAAGGAVSGGQRRTSRRKSSACRTAWSPESGPALLTLLCGRRRGHPHRLRQRRQSAAGARLGPRQGDRDSHRARRRPAAAGASDARPRASCWRWPAEVLGLLLAYLAIRPIQTLSAGSIPRVERRRRSTARCCCSRSASRSRPASSSASRRPGRRRARTIGSVLKEGGRSSTASSGRWVRSGLLVAEVAMSIVLLVGAALLLRSFARLTNVDPGFRPEHVLAFRVALPNTAVPREAPAHRVLRQAARRTRSPARGRVGRDDADAADARRLHAVVHDPGPAGAEARTRGRQPTIASSARTTSRRWAFRSLRGRAFTDRDGEKSPQVAVVDQTFVERYFPSEDPIGQGIDIGNGTDGFFEIVGVVGSVRHAQPRGEPGADDVRAVHSGSVRRRMWVVARTTGEPSGTLGRGAPDRAGDRRHAAGVCDDAAGDSRQRLGRAAPVLDAAARRCSRSIALFLAAVGLYGVVAYTVSQRTQEIGLRMAIGAQRGDVLRMVVGGGMKLALVGVAIGIACALALAQLVATMLFEVTPFDPGQLLGDRARAPRRRGAGLLRPRPPRDARGSDRGAEAGIDRLKAQGSRSSGTLHRRFCMSSKP